MHTRLQFFSILICLITFQSLQANELPSVDIHGFVSTGYMESNENNYLAPTEEGTFEFNEVGINFSSDLNDYLRLGTQLFAYNLGEHGGGDVNIDWAYGDIHKYDWLGLRIGKIKVPLGLYNQSRDVDAVRTWILLPQSVYPESFRALILANWGIDIYGVIDLNSVGSLEYESFLGSTSVDHEDPLIQGMFLSALDGIMDMFPGVPTPAIYSKNARLDYTFGGRVIWNSPLDGLRFAGSWGRAKASFDMSFQSPVGLGHGNGSWSAELMATIWSLSTEYQWKHLTLAAEYQRFQRPSVNVISVSELMSSFSTVSPSDQENYYISAEYLFDDRFTLGSYYSVHYPNRNDKSSSTRQYQKDWAITTRYDFNDYWLAKLEFHKIKGNAQVSFRDNPEGIEDDWCLILAKVTFSY